MEADLVITNGKVITVDKDFSIKQAVAVTDGKILAVGGNDEVKPFIVSGTRVLDLKGKTVLPGINDSHCHPGSFGAYRPPMAIDVGQAKAGSIREIAALVAARNLDRRSGLGPGQSAREPGRSRPLADPGRPRSSLAPSSGGPGGFLRSYPVG